jgi:hypothetical protein
MKKNYFLLLLPLFVFPTILFGQHRSPTGLIRCYTVEHEHNRRSKGLVDADYDKRFEEWLAPKIEEVKRQAASGKRAVITIPVVVHVIHDGDPINTNGAATNENISTAQVLSQISVLNEDFRKMAGTPGDGAGVDTEIQFCMAQTDPNGNATNGIDRVNLGTASWDEAGVEGTVKPNTIWDPEQYFNMWVVRFGGDLNGVLGYAQFPSGSGLSGICADGEAANTDGLVMGYQYFGTSDDNDGSFTFSAPYDKGRTATHEMGHGFGLRHIWGDGDCTVDDYCGDTPLSDAANFGCPNTNSCNDGSPDPRDQVENYMDYTDDTCMSIFTADQKVRIQAVVQNALRRSGLINSTKCQAPGPRIAFEKVSSSANENTSCGGTTNITVNMTIEGAPSANATVTLNFAGTATNNIDYTVTPSVLTFPAGSKANQSFTISIDQDANQESDETIVISYSLNANGGNAVAGNANMQVHTIQIKDDDFAPVASGAVVTNDLFAENWDDVGNAGAWTYAPAVATKANFWYILDDTCGEGIDCNTAQIINVKRVSGQWGFYCGYGANASAIDIKGPAFSTVGYTNLKAYFDWKCLGSSDYGNLIYSTNNGSTWTVAGSNLSGQSSVQAAAISMPNGVTNIGFRFTDNGSGISLPGFNVDNIVVKGDKLPSVIQTAINSGAGFAEHELGPNQTVHFFDQATGDIMATIQNTSAHDFGCTKVEVATQGTAFLNSDNEPIMEDFTSKTFKVTPQTNNTSAGYTITLYYTAAEVDGFASANASEGTITSGITYICKGPGTIGSAGTYETQAATPVAWGTGYTLTGSFTSGFSGFGGGDAPGAPFPVELLNISAKAGRSNIALEWATASERNNRGFEIERSVVGYGNFEKIGWVAGNGTTSERHSYTFDDIKVQKGVTYYYRLKQLDTDGKVDYSRIVNAIIKDRTLGVSFVPNPAKSEVQLFVTNAPTGRVSVQVMNVQGQLVNQFKGDVRNGESLKMDISNYPIGIYLVRVSDDLQSVVQKLVVE